MAVMIKGKFHARDPDPGTVKGGEFTRAASSIRHWIAPEGSFLPEHGRYHLYVAWNCPWAHRTLLARVLLALEDAITVAYACPRRTADGWVYDETGPYSDPELGITALHEVYARQHPGYTGNLTVPVLWDRGTGRIVSNESADIVRMLGSFGQGMDLWPAGLTPEIEEWNTLIYRTVNNGVYRAGFARTQSAYDRAVAEVFDTLDKIEARLATADWLVGDQFTEADLRLFPTLARFDVAYHYAFKCNIKRISEYPNLWRYARRVYAMPGVAGTVDFKIYKQGYFSPSELRNPLGIVPMGPMINWSL
jgi:putative glutathione S-transferase